MVRRLSGGRGLVHSLVDGLHEVYATRTANEAGASMATDFLSHNAQLLGPWLARDIAVRPGSFGRRRHLKESWMRLILVVPVVASRIENPSSVSSKHELHTRAQLYMSREVLSKLWLNSGVPSKSTSEFGISLCGRIVLEIQDRGQQARRLLVYTTTLHEAVLLTERLCSTKRLMT